MRGIPSILYVTKCVHRFRWLIIAFWALAAVSTAYFAAQFIGVTTQAFTMTTGTEGYEGMLAMEKNFPNSAPATHVVMFIQKKNTAPENVDFFTVPQVQNFSHAVCADFNEWMSQEKKDSNLFGTCLSYFDNSVGVLRRQFVAPSNTSGVVHVQVNVNPFGSFSNDLTDKMNTLLDRHKHILDPYFDVGLNGVNYFIRSAVSSVGKDLGRMDSIVLPLAMLILAYFVRSLRLIIIPGICIGLTAALSFATMYLIGSTILTVNSLAPSLMMSVLIAMSIDYSLFMLTRYREEIYMYYHPRGVFDVELRNIELASPHLRLEGTIQRMSNVLATAGHTISVSGITFAACFFSLCSFGREWMTSVGVGCAVVILFSLAVNLTFVPALTMAFPNFFENCVTLDDRKKGKDEKNHDHHQQQQRIDTIGGTSDVDDEDDEGVGRMDHASGLTAITGVFRRFQKKVETSSYTYENTFYFKLGTIITKFPYNIILCVAILALCVPVARHSFGYSRSNSNLYYLPRGDPVLNGLIDMQSEFGAGYLSPYQLLLLPEQPTFNAVLNKDFFERAQFMLLEFLNHPDLPGTTNSSAMGLVMVDGQMTNFDELLPCMFQNTTRCQMLNMLRFGMVNLEGNAMWLSLSLSIDPIGRLGEDWYQNAVALSRELEKKYKIGKIYLTGEPTQALDSVRYAVNRFPVIMIVTSAVVFVVVALAFRSILIPLRSVVTIATTVLFIFGLTALTYDVGVFNWTGIASLKSIDAVVWAEPILSFSIILGVGLDYDIFLLSRTLEYVPQYEDATPAIVYGLASTGSIITAAGVIMGVAFSGLLLSEVETLNQLGFMMVTAVIFDTFVVRSLLVPAMMSLFGEWNWWPAGKKSWARSDRRRGSVVSVGASSSRKVSDLHLNDDLDGHGAVVHTHFGISKAALNDDYVRSRLLPAAEE
eukprot:PhM_4_TR17011/c0_g1_i2/m.68989/K06994/K06994; putative drug exporter of the RND superfamily